MSAPNRRTLATLALCLGIASACGYYGPPVRGTAGPDPKPTAGTPSAPAAQPTADDREDRREEAP